MHGQDTVAASAAGQETADRRWPARVDALQSLSGLALTLFLAVHLLLDAAILVGPPAADWVAHLFEGEPFFGRRYSAIVSVAALGLLLLVALHAALALRRLPCSVAQYQTLRAHAARLHHADTRLWWWQVVTGFVLFFLVGAHLAVMITQPEAIGAQPSAERVVAARAGIFYLLFLPVVLVHAAVGLYRLAIKWGWPAGIGRAALKRSVGLVALAYLLLGLAALAAYAALGMKLAG
mgnify:CR=1 FL=1